MTTYDSSGRMTSTYRPPVRNPTWYQLLRGRMLWFRRGVFYIVREVPNERRIHQAPRGGDA